jgi:hypothetical protein
MDFGLLDGTSLGTCLRTCGHGRRGSLRSGTATAFSSADMARTQIAMGRRSYPLKNWRPGVTRTPDLQFRKLCRSLSAIMPILSPSTPFIFGGAQPVGAERERRRINLAGRPA